MQQRKASDLRVKKTREAIQQAFKEMICTMDASEITVKELAERARIHRKTFYLHYPCMESLFEEIMHTLAEQYFEQIDQISMDAPFTEVNRIFFTYMANQEPFVEKMVCTPSYHAFCDKLFTVMLRHNRNRHNPYRQFSEEEQNIINTFLAVGSLNLYRQWVQDGKKLPLSDLIQLSGKLFTNGISSVIQQKNHIDK